MSHISQILQKYINSQLLDYFENHELLRAYRNQSAFWKHKNLRDNMDQIGLMAHVFI